MFAHMLTNTPAPSYTQSPILGNLGLLLLRLEKLNMEGLGGRQDEPVTESHNPHVKPVDVESPEVPLQYLLPLITEAKPRDPDLACCEAPLPVKPLEIISSMCSLTEMRGGQSCGLASVSWMSNQSSKIVRQRSIVKKRSSGAVTMTRAWMSEAGTLASKLLSTPSVVLLGHLRFATSSRNRVAESHPHIWVPIHSDTVYNISSSGISAPYEGMVGHVLTHNGDFDAVRLYDIAIPMKNVGLWLERVLNCPSHIDSDSSKIAGYFDVFSTRGRWFASARRAWVLAVAQSELDVCGGQVLSIGAPNTAPTVEQIRTWSATLSSEFNSSALSKSKPSDPSFASALSTFEAAVLKRFKSQKHTHGINHWKTTTIDDFVIEAISSFFTADSYSCMSTFLRSASGSFGIAVSCATEQGSVVIAAQGQPMAVAVDPNVGLFLYGSESSAIRVPVQENNAPLSYRYNLNDQAGEAIRIGLGNDNEEYVSAIFSVNPSDYSSQPDRPLEMPLNPEWGSRIKMSFDFLYCPTSLDEVIENFETQDQAAVLPGSGDIVATDLAEIPDVLREITLDWGRAESHNRQAANDFVHLFADALFRHKSGGLDLLITGIESSLWLGEQLAADFKIIFPSINVVCVTSNKLLGALEDVPRMVHFCGYNRITAEKLKKDKPVVLCISQSGQTFATLHATRQLLSILHGNVFLVTGLVDTKMREAVADCLGPEAVERRIIHNHSGVRVAEPSTVACAAMHHTLTEFLLYVSCACAVASEQVAKVKAPQKDNRVMTPPWSNNSKGNAEPNAIDLSALKMSVIKEDLIDFRDLLDSLHENLVDLFDTTSRINTKLRHQGEYWSKHITESWRVMVLSGMYILVTVVSGYPLFSFVLSFFPDTIIPLVYAFRVLDAFLYIMLPKLFSYMLRLCENRTVFARHGKRTLVICDVPWVHMCLENYVSKLFALSYSFLNIEVHGSCAHDDMVHCFTHRVARGTLLALGRPDGRVLSLLKTEQTIMLAAKQAAFIENMSVGPEFFTIGHNNVQSSIASSHICISSTRRKFLSETLYDFALAAKTSTMVDQGNFEVASKKILVNLYEQSVKLGPAYPRRLLSVGVMHARDDGNKGGPAPPSESNDHRPRQRSNSNISASSTDRDDHAEEVLALSAKMVKLDVSDSSDVPADRENRASFLGGTPRSTPMNRSARRSFFAEPLDLSMSGHSHFSEVDSLDEMQGDPLQGSKHASLKLSLDARYAFAARLPKDVRRKLDKTQIVEHLYESRVASFERYLSMLVVFHSMADKASKPWLLPGWNVSRSQSNLRVATTACPVSVEEDDEGEDLDASVRTEFDSSKHIVERSKQRLMSNLNDDLAEHFPASAVDESGTSRSPGYVPVPVTKSASVPRDLHLAER